MQWQLHFVLYIPIAPPSSLCLERIHLSGELSSMENSLYEDKVVVPIFGVKEAVKTMESSFILPYMVNAGSAFQTWTETEMLTAKNNAVRELLQAYYNNVDTTSR